MSASTAKPAAREQTRRQLIDAAERLFADSGIDGVSLRQINVAAGQKNSSAAHYHFGSKEALILAIYNSRMESVNARREKLLDRMEAEGTESDLRCLVEALVYPIVEEIDSGVSGRHYIRFMAQAMGHPQLDLTKLQSQKAGSGIGRIIDRLYDVLPHLEGPLLGQRFGLAFEQIIHSLADRERLRNQAGRRNFEVDSALFVSNLVDSIAGAMEAPVSATTKKELDRLSRKAGQA